MPNATVDHVLRALWPDPDDAAGEWYALLDGARDPRIYPMLRDSLVDSCCLYAGDLPRDLAEVAPYLVALGRCSRFTARLIELGWGNSWGVFLRSPAIMQDLRRHFRRFLQVRDEAGRRMLFRFYDPRVLRVFLPSCTPVELRGFFGPVDRFVLEGDDSEQVLTFHADYASPAQDAASIRATRASQTPPIRPSALLPFVFRSEHLEAFRPLADVAFARRLAIHIRKDLMEVRVRLPEGVRYVRQIPRDNLRLMITSGLTRARGHGLSWESSLAVFCHLMFLVAPNFDEQAAISQVLGDPSSAPEQRIDALWDRVGDDDWRDARRNYRADAWYSCEAEAS